MELKFLSEKLYKTRTRFIYKHVLNKLFHEFETIEIWVIECEIQKHQKKEVTFYGF